MIHTVLPGFSYPSKAIESFIADSFVGCRDTPTLPELREAIADIRAKALQFFDFTPSDWNLDKPEFINSLNAVTA